MGPVNSQLIRTMRIAALRQDAETRPAERNENINVMKKKKTGSFSAGTFFQHAARRRRIDATKVLMYIVISHGAVRSRGEGGRTRENELRWTRGRREIDDARPSRIALRSATVKGRKISAENLQLFPSPGVSRVADSPAAAAAAAAATESRAFVPFSRRPSRDDRSRHRGHRQLRQTDRHADCSRMHARAKRNAVLRCGHRTQPRFSSHDLATALRRAETPGLVEVDQFGSVPKGKHECFL